MAKRSETETAPFSIVWSPVNRAWFVMFFDQVLRVVNTRAEALEILADMVRQ